MIYEIPIIPGKVPPVIHISQGDSGRIISLQITGDNIPAAAQAEIKGIRPDGAGVTQTVQYGTGTSKGLIVWAVNRLFTEIEGDAICEVYLNYNSQYIGTQNFILRVEKAAYKPDAPTPWSSVTITEPGTYNVRPYGEVIVDMEAGPQPEGTIEIRENNKTYDVAAFAAASVNVPQREEPSGTKNITTNGDYDISEYANAHVAVEGGSQPEGTVTIRSNGVIPISEYAYADVDVEPEGETTITSNGTHNVAEFSEAVVDVHPVGRTVLLTNGTHDVTDFSEAEVDVPSGVDWCVTPEDFGAGGTGETDDTVPFAQAVATGKTVVCAGIYAIDGIEAYDLDLLLLQKAEIRRRNGGHDPFISINTDRPEGHITKRSYIRGGTINAGEAEIAIAVNGSEELTVQNVEIRQCHTGLYIGYVTGSAAKYSIETRIDNVKFTNKLNEVGDPEDYVDSIGIRDECTDSQYSNIIVENFHTGMVVGGNAEVNNFHHWISRAEIYDGSMTFRVDENKSGFFTDCCSDSVETAFSVGPYSKTMVKGFSQVRNGLMQGKTRMNYLVADTGEGTADAAKTMWFFSYGSAHSGHSAIGSEFYEVSDNVYARYQSQGPAYDNRLILDGAAISNMAAQGGRNNIIPFGYNALGQIKNFAGTSDAFLYNFSFDDIKDNGCYYVQMQTSTGGPAGIMTGASSLIVSGYDNGKMQLLVNNTEGIFYRMYNGSWQPWRVLADVIAGKVPAIYNFSGDSTKAYLTGCDLNSVTTPGLYGIQTSSASNKPAGVTSGTLNLWVGGVCDETTPIMSLVQAAITKDSLYVRARSQNSGGEWVWTAWTQIGGAPDLGNLANFQGQQAKSWKDTDLNTIKDPGMYAFNPSSSAVLNKPSGLSGTKANVWVGGTPNSKSQLILNEGGLFLRFYAANTDTWTEWVKLTA